jgi:hypothetical protein
MKLAYFESMDVTLGKGRLSSVLKNSCIHASIQKKAIRHGNETFSTNTLIPRPIKILKP